jgi:hypothetical protein
VGYPLKKSKKKATKRQQKPRKRRVWDKRSIAIAALRKASRFWPARTAVLKAASASFGQYRCEACKKPHDRKNVQVDHVEPVVPVSGWEGFDSYVERLFCETSGLAVLCKTCHKKKTGLENIERRKARAA